MFTSLPLPHIKLSFKERCRLLFQMMAYKSKTTFQGYFRSLFRALGNFALVVGALGVSLLMSEIETFFKSGFDCSYKNSLLKVSLGGSINHI